MLSQIPHQLSDLPPHCSDQYTRLLIEYCKLRETDTKRLFERQVLPAKLMPDRISPTFDTDDKFMYDLRTDEQAHVVEAVRADVPDHTYAVVRIWDHLTDRQVVLGTFADKRALLNINLLAGWRTNVALVLDDPNVDVQLETGRFDDSMVEHAKKAVFDKYFSYSDNRMVGHRQVSPEVAQQWKSCQAPTKRMVDYCNKQDAGIEQTFMNMAHRLVLYSRQEFIAKLATKPVDSVQSGEPKFYYDLRGETSFDVVEAVHADCADDTPLVVYITNSKTDCKVVMAKFVGKRAVLDVPLNLIASMYTSFYVVMDHQCDVKLVTGCFDFQVRQHAATVARDNNLQFINGQVIVSS